MHCPESLLPLFLEASRPKHTARERVKEEPRGAKGTTLGNFGKKMDKHKVDESILEPYNYLSSAPGKDIRSKLIDCFQEWMQIDAKKLIVIKELIRMLHNASLLIDDIEDNSKMRRGMPAAHTIYGIPSTINCANYVYFLAMEKCTELDQPECTCIFMKELLNLHRGQGQDILWREECKCPTEDEYKAMVSDKTGGLFRLAISLMGVFAQRSDLPDFGKLIYLFGLYFQIRDDYVNIASAEYMKEKCYCEDLSEGKFSFPMIHCIRTHATDRRLLNILRQRTEDLEVKRHAVQYITDCGSLRYTRQVLEDLFLQIEAEIRGPCGGHSSLLRLLQVLHTKLDEVQGSSFPKLAGGGVLDISSASTNRDGNGTAAAMEELSNGARQIIFGTPPR